MALQVASVGKTYTLSIAPNVSYPDTDGLELTNEVLGNGADYSDASWQGHQDLAAALDVTVDLGSLKGNLQQFRSYFLQDTPNGIHRPDTVEILTSTDGAAYTSRGTTAMAAATNDTGDRWVYALSITGVTARYLRWRITRQAGLEWVFLGEVEAYRDFYSDTFDRATNTSLGSPWIEGESNSGALSISSSFPNRLRIVIGDLTPYYGFAYWNDATDNDQRSRLTFNQYTSGPDQGGPAVRIAAGSTATSFTGYVVAYSGTGTPTIFIRKFVADTLANHSSSDVLGSVATTLVDNDTLTAEAAGTQIRALVNGITVLAVTDSELTSGYAGFAGVANSASQTNYVWYDWQGGDLALFGIEAPRIYAEHYLRNNVLDEFPYIFAEGFLRGFDYIPPVESKRIMGEHFLKGIVDPELGYIRADHFLKGKDALTGPPPTRITYVTRGSKRRITWET